MVITKKLTFRAVAELLGLLITAVGVIYISRVVGPEYLGFSATASALLLLVSKLADSGVTSLASQRLARDDMNLSELLSITFPFKLVSSLLLIILTLTIVSFLNVNSTLKYFIRISSFLVLFEAVTPIWVFVSVGMINVASTIRITQSFVYIMVIFIVIQKPGDWIYLPYLLLVNYIIGFIFTNIFMFYYKKYSFARSSFDINFFKRIKDFFLDSIHYLKADLSAYVYSTSDRLILYYFAGSYTVGIYEAAYKVIYPFYAINNVITPTMFRDLAQSYKNNQLGAMFPKYVVSMAILTIPLGFFLVYFSDFLINTIYGSNFSGSIPCLQILGFVITFGFAAAIIVIPFSAWNMAREYGNALFFGNVLNTFFNFALIPLIGAIGAAIATLIAKIVVLIVGYGYFRKSVTYPILKDLTCFFIASTIALLMTVLASYGTNNNYLLMAIFGMIYVALTLLALKYFLKYRLVKEN